MNPPSSRYIELPPLSSAVSMVEKYRALHCTEKITHLENSHLFTGLNQNNLTLFHCAITTHLQSVKGLRRFTLRLGILSIDSVIGHVGPLEGDGSLKGTSGGERVLPVWKACQKGGGDRAPSLEGTSGGWGSISEGGESSQFGRHIRRGERAQFGRHTSRRR